MDMGEAYPPPSAKSMRTSRSVVITFHGVPQSTHQSLPGEIQLPSLLPPSNPTSGQEIGHSITAAKPWEPPPVVIRQSRPTTVAFGQALALFSKDPVSMTCPHCHSTMVTTVEHTLNKQAWRTALIVCLLGGFLGCCLIPLCMERYKDIEHHCSNCNKSLGSANIKDLEAL